MAVHDELGSRFEAVRGRVTAACRRAGRDPQTVTLLPVTKGVPVDVLLRAAEVGESRFAENRVQEATPKIAALPDAEWHLVGTLQANKARRALQLFAVIQSVDSVDLARRLAHLAGELGRPARIYLQVNVDQDAAKAGFDPDGLERALHELAAVENVRIEGLMTVGRLVGSAEEARPTFAALRELSRRLRDGHPRLGFGLSMGMSHDFEVSVEEGATIIRVGTAIFGERRPA